MLRNYIELRQRHTTRADAWFQALEESIVSREVGGAIAQRLRSLMSTIALLLLS